MDLSSSSSSTSASSGFITEPPLSPGAPDVPPASAQIPLSGPPLRTAPRPVLEAQVVRMGLMTPDQVASTMRDEAETGRPFAELAVANGHISAEDLEKLMGMEAEPAAEVPDAPPVQAPAPVAPAPQPDPTPPPAAAAESAPAPEPAPVPAAPATPEPQARSAPPAASAPVAPTAPVAAAPAPKPEPVPTASVAGQGGTVSAEVFVRLTSRERISVGIFERRELAEARARELMGQLGGHGNWPCIEGRYIRPDAVVSIDVELTGTN